MELLKDRPLASSLFAFAATSTASAYLFGPTVSLFLSVLLLIAFSASLILPKISARIRAVVPRRHRFLASALLLATAIGVILPTLAFGGAQAIINKYIGESDVPVTFVIDEITYTGAAATFANVTLTSIDGEECDIQVRCTVAGRGFAIGDTVRACADVRELIRDDYYTFARESGCLAEIEVDEEHEIVSHSDERQGSRTYAEIRARLSSRITSSVSEGGALLAALALGDRSDIDGTFTLALRRTGTSHLLAISGLHLSLLAGIVVKLLSFIGVPRKAKYTVGAVFVIFYAHLVGAPSSVVRAAVMTVILFISYILSKESDGITTIAIAVSGMILLSPRTLYDVGFYLSVCATLAIVVLGEIRGQSNGTNEKSVIHKLRSTVAVTLAALVATIPVSMLTFGEFSLITPLSNLILAPYAELLLIIAPIALIFGDIAVVSRIAGILATTFIHITTYISDIRGISISLAPTWAKVTVTLTVGAVLLLILSRHGTMRRITASLVIGVTAFAVCFGISGAVQRRHVDVSVVSYGNDDISVVLDGDAYLIDATSGAYSAYAESLKELKARAYTELEGIILTHYHNRHITLISRLAASIKVYKIYLPVPITESEEALMRSISAICDEHGIAHELYDGEMDFEAWTAAPLPREYLSRSTHPIVAFSVSTSADSFLYLGESYLEGSYVKLAAKHVYDSEHIFIGSHGPVSKEAYGFTEYGSLESISIGMKCDSSPTPSAINALPRPVKTTEGVIKVRLK